MMEDLDTPPSETREILTPDFYNYAWAELESVQVDHHFVERRHPLVLTGCRG